MRYVIIEDDAALRDISRFSLTAKLKDYARRQGIELSPPLKRKSE